MKTLLICCLMVFLPLGASAMLDGDNPPGGNLIETAEIVEVIGGTTLSYPLFESGSYTVDLQIGDNTYHLIVRDM